MAQEVKGRTHNAVCYILLFYVRADIKLVPTAVVIISTFNAGLWLTSVPSMNNKGIPDVSKINFIPLALTYHARSS